MASDNLNTPPQQQQNQFFKVLLQDFLNKLYIPPKFGKNIIKQEHGDAIIKGPFGNTWRVKVQQDSKGLYFGEGWRDFAVAHDLSVGWFLVFKYEGNMDFSVTVFDVSACEKVYAPDKKSFIPDIKTPVSSCSSEGPNAKHRKANVREHTKVGATSASKARQQPYPSRSSPPGTHFTVTMKPCHLNKRKPYMNIPAIFQELSSKREVILRDPGGRKWPVRIYHQTRNNHNVQSMLGAGWQEFRDHNNLKKGDNCIFQITPDKENDIMDVRIFRK